MSTIDLGNSRRLLFNTKMPQGLNVHFTNTLYSMVCCYEGGEIPNLKYDFYYMMSILFLCS